MRAALCGKRSAGATIMGPTNVSQPLALRPRYAAKALGISPRTLWGLTAPPGPIPCLRIGHGKRQTVLYPVADLEVWLSPPHANANGVNGGRPRQSEMSKRRRYLLTMRAASYGRSHSPNPLLKDSVQ